MAASSAKADTLTTPSIEGLGLGTVGFTMTSPGSGSFTALGTGFAQLTTPNDVYGSSTVTYSLDVTMSNYNAVSGTLSVYGDDISDMDSGHTLTAQQIYSATINSLTYDVTFNRFVFTATSTGTALSPIGSSLYGLIIMADGTFVGSPFGDNFNRTGAAIAEAKIYTSAAAPLPSTATAGKALLLGLWGTAQLRRKRSSFAH
jgi:hypothetical protein